MFLQWACVPSSFRVSSDAGVWRWAHSRCLINFAFAWGCLCKKPVRSWKTESLFLPSGSPKQCYQILRLAALLEVCSGACWPLVLGFVSCLWSCCAFRFRGRDGRDLWWALAPGRQAAVWSGRTSHLLHLVSGRKTLLFHKPLFVTADGGGIPRAPVASGSDLEG